MKTQARHGESRIEDGRWKARSVLAHARTWRNFGAGLIVLGLALSAGSWATSGYTISTLNGTNSISIPSPAGKLFFRLKQ